MRKLGQNSKTETEQNLQSKKFSTIIASSNSTCKFLPRSPLSSVANLRGYPRRPKIFSIIRPFLFGKYHNVLRGILDVCSTSKDLNFINVM